MNGNGDHDLVTRWLAGVSAFLLTLIFAALVYSAVQGPSTSERLTSVEDQLSFITCLVLLEPPDRTPEAVASCQSQDTG